MNIKCIGTGTMGCDNRTNNSILVNDSILFDIGTGVLNQLRKYNIKLNKIEYIIISHYHADHFLDIVNFLIRRNIRKETENKLTIIGPKDVKEKIVELMYFTHGDGSSDKYNNIEEKYNIEFAKLNEEEKEFNDFSLKSISLKHGNTFPCNGYVLKTKDYAIGYTGDTTICSGLAELINLSDHIFIDVAFKETTETHLGYLELEQIAKENLNKKFYAVHRGDYVIKNLTKNIIVPMDGDEYNI